MPSILQADQDKLPNFKVFQYPHLLLNYLLFQSIAIPFHATSFQNKTIQAIYKVRETLLPLLFLRMKLWQHQNAQFYETIFQ